jgi:hypothetical protein
VEAAGGDERVASQNRAGPLPALPLGCADAARAYAQYLTAYERREILEYPEVYFLGVEAAKLRGASKGGFPCQAACSPPRGTCKSLSTSVHKAEVCGTVVCCEATRYADQSVGLVHGLMSTPWRAANVCSAELNFGYDDDRGDYNTVKKDHLAYRYEILGIVGKGSFGQVI